MLTAVLLLSAAVVVLLGCSMTSLAVTPTDRQVVTTGSQGTPNVDSYQTVRPLYSSAGLNSAALPAELPFFSYKKGDLVPGAGNAAGILATGFNTNMVLAGQLPRPELFTITGVRIYMPQIRFSGSGVPNLPEGAGFGAASQNGDLIEDLLVLTYSTWLEIEIGEKFYVRHPTYLLPSNIGYGGVASQAQDNGTAATTGSLDIALVNTVGVYWRLWPFMAADGTRGPVLLAEQQALRARLRTGFTTPALNQSRLVFLFLDGIHTRASQ